LRVVGSGLQLLRFGVCQSFRRDRMISHTRLDHDEGFIVNGVASSIDLGLGTYNFPQMITTLFEVPIVKRKLDVRVL
jgi:hypothetical protein